MRFDSETARRAKQVKQGTERARYWAQLDYVNCDIARVTKHERWILNGPWVLPAERQDYMQDLTWLLEGDKPPQEAKKSETSSDG